MVLNIKSIPYSDEPDAGTASNAPTPPTPPTPPQDDLSGLKSALQKERDRANALEKEYARLRDQFKDIDPAKYAQLEELQKRAEEWNQRETELKQQLENEFTERLKQEQKRSEEYLNKYQNLVLRTQAEKAYQAAGGRAGAGEDGLTFFDAFFVNVQKNLRLSDRGEIEVIDSTGARLFSKKDATKPMSANEYFANLANHPVFGHYFAPQQPGRGGGMQPNTNLPAQADISHLSRSERLTLLRQAKINSR